MMSMQPNPHAQPRAAKHPDWIVAHDPRGEFGDGSLVDAARNQQLRARGVATLPVDPGTFRGSGVAGFFKRSWGSGYPLSADLPRPQCPLILYLDPGPVARAMGGAIAVHWVARLVGGTKHGSIRLAVDTAQQATLHAQLPQSSAVDLAALGPADAAGGWTVTGEATAHAPMRGYYGFALYGVGRGVRVAWAALSATLSQG